MKVNLATESAVVEAGSGGVLVGELVAAVDRAERPYDRNPGTAKQRKELSSELEGVRAELRKHREGVVAAGGDELAVLDKAIAKHATEVKLEKKSPAYGYHSGSSSMYYCLCSSGSSSCSNRAIA